jgi:hypothetical protein
MKKFFAFASLLALTLSACTEKEPQSEQKGEGQVTITLATSAEVDTRAQISCTTPELADFALQIEGVGYDYAKEYASISEFNADNYLRFGQYRATVVAGDVMNEGYDKATFVGSKEFSVAARKHTDVEITAHIANALVVVETTEAFDNYFVGGRTLKLTTAAGNEFDVTAQSEPLFVAPESVVVTGTAIKQSAQSGAEGAVVALPEYELEVAAQTLYRVKFDVEQAGGATLTISLNDELVESIDIEQELNDNAQ